MTHVSRYVSYANLSKYRDTYRIVTHVSRYVSYREGTVSLHPYSLVKVLVIRALNCARILVVHALNCAQFLLHHALFPI